MPAPKIDPLIFRAYDIRGKAMTQLTTEAARLIAHAFGTVLQERYGKGSYYPTVVVGRDARTHGGALEDEVIAGLVAAGCAVKHIGMTPSTVNYFTIATQRFDGGMQVTASHNPKEDNGLKLQLRDAQAYSGEDLQDLRQRIENGVFGSGQGSVEACDGVTPYLDYMERIFKGVGDGVSVVVDSGNGVAGPVYVEALKLAGAKVTGMYVEPDGNFPNHPADPSKHATLRELQAKVVEMKADCGFGFDGDGDRVGVVDERGVILSADQILLLLAKDHLSRHPGMPVIFTVSNSAMLETEIEKWGGKPVMCKVGHSFVEHAMRENKAMLGGEQSGHFFTEEDYFGFDDALVASLRILKILVSASDGESEKNQIPNAKFHKLITRSLSKLIEQFPRVFQSPERRPRCPDDEKAAVVVKITESFKKKYPVNVLDGARIDFGDGAWAGIRHSNTSPCLSVCIEARSPEKLKEVEKIVLDELKKYPEVEME